MIGALAAAAPCTAELCSATANEGANPRLCCMARELAPERRKLPIAE